MDLEPESPQVPCPAASRKISLLSPALVFSGALRHQATQTVSGEQVIYHCPSVWQAAGSGAVVALKSEPL